MQKVYRDLSLALILFSVSIFNHTIPFLCPIKGGFCLPDKNSYIVCDTSFQDEGFAAEMLKQLYIFPMCTSGMTISTRASFPASVLSHAGHYEQLPAEA